ncbi:integral membrane protein DUF92-domain-containing protein [Mycena haematopus]|nr:integral membrane protein DUF92-domain-containing protein [Mycena haematopus]
MTVPHISIVSVLLPTILAAHGLSKKSLSPSGALTAFFVGFFMFSGSLKLWGVSLIGFYLLGSRATKYGKQRKAKLEAGYHDYGNRSGWQVLSNSFSAAVACSAWNIFFDPQGVHAFVARGALAAGATTNTIAQTYTNDTWCPSSGDVGNGWSRALLFAALGHFACCLGDTLASELGILSICLIVENSACRSAWFSLSRDFIIWGAFGGVGGSGLDSLLGATIQTTRYDDERKLVVEDGEKDKLKVIGGWDILTNNQVNVVSSVSCAVIIGLLA